MVLAKDAAPGSEAKKFCSSGIVVTRFSAFSLQFPEPQLPQGDTKRVGGHLHIQWAALQERSPNLREPESGVMGRKQAHGIQVIIFVILEVSMPTFYSGGKESVISIS